MRARVRQYRIRSGAYHRPRVPHRDDIEIERARRVAVTPHPAGALLDGVQPGQQSGWIGYRGGRLERQSRDGVDMGGWPRWDGFGKGTREPRSCNPGSASKRAAAQRAVAIGGSPSRSGRLAPIPIRNMRNESGGVVHNSARNCDGLRLDRPGSFCFTRSACLPIVPAAVSRGQVRCISCREKIALFIDGANLYSASRNLGFDVDYRNLLEFFRKKAHVIRAYYYSAVLETDEYSPLKPLTDWLAYNGYTLVTKPAREFTDSAGRRRVKGNMDIEVAVDMLELAPRLDPRILFSGTPISAAWWKPCRQGACASRLYPRSAPARRWWPTNFAGRQTSSWNWLRSSEFTRRQTSRGSAPSRCARPRRTFPDPHDAA